MVSKLGILLISAQTDLIHQIRAYLQSLDSDCHVVSTPAALEDEFRDTLEVCIIDAQTDTVQALELIKRLRKVQPLAGIVCISARNDPATRLKALKNGADHAVTSPLDDLELNAVMQSLARFLKSPQLTQHLVQAQPHGIELHILRRTIQGRLSQQLLTQNEFLLLQSLLRAKDQQLELWQIYDILGKTEKTLQKTALEAQISRLRKKLRDSGAGNQALRSIRLKGYQLCCPIWIS